MAFNRYVGLKQNDPDSGGGMGGNTGMGAVGGGGGAPADDPLALMMQFIHTLMGPLDLNDPLVKNIVGGAYSATGADAAARGVGGPASANASQQAYVNAAAGLQGQRQQLAGSLLNSAGQLNLDTKSLQYTSDYNKWLAQMQQGQGLGSAIGGAIGGVAGGVGGFALGGPAGAVMGAGAGAKLGSGVGGGLGGMGAGGGGPPSFGSASRGLAGGA